MSIAILSATVALALGCQNATTTAANDDADKLVTTTTPAAIPANTANNALPAQQDAAPRITLADAKSAFDAGDSVFVDVRAEAIYKAEHIKGSVNITPDKLDSKLSSLSKDKKLIVYCS